MNKHIKIITLGVLSTLLLTTANCFAVSSIDEITVNKDGVTYLYQNYEVQEKEETEFLSKLERQITKDEKSYVLESINKTGGNVTDTIDIQTTKQIATKSNSTEAILKKLPQTIEYAKDGYIGEYKIDLDSLITNSNYNGYYEQLIEDTKQYFDLNRNDLSYIPKQIIKDGIKLDLIKTDWYEQTTKLVGANTVPDKYRAECYYAGKKKVDNPLTYTTTVSYIGIATKITEKPLIYKIEYKSITKDINYIPYIIGSTGAIFIVIIVIWKKKSKRDKEV